jgi:hypothetical protein
VSLYVAVCLSAFLAAVLVYRYDLYNREPWYLIALAAGLGFATMRVAATTELWALASFEPTRGSAVRDSRETRLAGVVAIAFAFRGFDDLMDGIIYGSWFLFHFLQARRELQPQDG